MRNNPELRINGWTSYRSKDYFKVKIKYSYLTLRKTLPTGFKCQKYDHGQLILKELPLKMSFWRVLHDSGVCTTITTTITTTTFINTQELQK